MAPARKTLHGLAVVPGNPPAITLIEPNLRQPSGHYLELVRALGSAVEPGGPAFRVIAPAQAREFLAGMAGVTWDPESVDGGGRMRPEIGRVAALMRQRLPFLILTAKAKHALAMELIHRLYRVPLNRAACFFHWPERKPGGRLMLLAAPAVRRQALGIAPTRGIADGYRSCGWSDLRTVPYPALPPAQLDSSPPVSCTHLLMAGAARLNKGLDLLTELVERWVADPPAVPPVIRVQLSPKHFRRQGRTEAGLAERLRGSGYPRLECMANAPDRAAYLAQFQGALVLAPYVHAQFRHGVSGIVLDALLGGAPVVTTSGTWAAEVVQRFGAGMVMEERSVDALERAIRQVLSNWEHHAAGARAAACALADEHHPRHLYRELAGSLADFAAGEPT